MRLADLDRFRRMRVGSRSGECVDEALQFGQVAFAFRFPWRQMTTSARARATLGLTVTPSGPRWEPAGSVAREGVGAVRSADLAATQSASLTRMPFAALA